MNPRDPRNPIGYKFLAANVGHVEDGCLIWPYSICTPGYGQFAYQGKKGILAHRFMCELKNGPAPTASHHAAHSCGNRRCVNPTHLSWKTPADNQIDRRAHGTNNKTKSKLTQRQADQIRRLKGIETSVETAARYGVTESNVRLIQEGITWRGDCKINYWTQEQRARLAELLKAGLKHEEIAVDLNRSIESVRARAAKLGLKSRRGPYGVLLSERRT